MIKKIISLAVVATTLFTMMATTALGQYDTNFDINAQSVFLINSDTEEVMLDINSDAKINPGDMTKLVTALVAVENTTVPLSEATASMNITIQNYLYNIRLEQGAVTLGGFWNGEEITLDKLLYAVLLPGANDAAMMVAHYVGDGSEDYFVSLMNEKVKEIGAVNTNFTNSHGISGDNHYTTAYDMHLILQYALENPTISSILKTTSFDGGPTNKNETLLWHNGNRTIVSSSDYFYPYIGGGVQSKGPDGYSFASTATKDGYSYTLVVMGSENPLEEVQPAFTEAIKIYDWVFSAFKVKTVIEKGETISELPLELATGSKDHLKLMSGSILTSLLPESIDVSSITMELDLPEAVNAPVERGDFIGTANFSLAGKFIGSVEIQSAETVSASSTKVFIDDMLKLTESFWFKFTVVLVVLLVIAYIGLLLYFNRRKRRGRFRRR